MIAQRVGRMALQRGELAMPVHMHPRGRPSECSHMADMNTANVVYQPLAAKQPSSLVAQTFARSLVASHVSTAQIR